MVLVDEQAGADCRQTYRAVNAIERRRVDRMKQISGLAEIGILA